MYASLLASLCSASPALAQWKVGERQARIGDPPACAIEWREYGIQVVKYRWPAGADTEIFMVGDAQGQGPLELFIEGLKPVRARAADRGVWSQPHVVEALLAAKKFRVAWNSHGNERRSAEVSLDGFAAARQACEEQLGKAARPG